LKPLVDVAEFKKPNTHALALHGNSAIVKSVQRRKTFSLGGFSQLDKPAAPPTDSLDMYNVIGEVAEIFKKTDDHQPGPSCTVDEDLSTQEIDAHLSREYSTTSRSNTPAEDMNATQNRNALSDSNKVKWLQVKRGKGLSIKFISSKAISDHLDVMESQLLVSNSQDQLGIRALVEPAVLLKTTIASQGNNSKMCLTPPISSENSHAVSSLSGLSYSILEQNSKLYESSEVVSLNSESVSQSLSTQDIGQQTTHDSEQIDYDIKKMKLIGNTGPVGKPIRNDVSTKSADLTQDSQPMKYITKNAQTIVIKEHEGEQTVKDVDLESTNSISDEMLMQVWLPKTGVETSQPAETSGQGCNSIPALAELDLKQASVEDDSSYSESGWKYKILFPLKQQLWESD